MKKIMGLISHFLKYQKIKKNGQSYYHLTNENKVSLGDESGVHIRIYEVWDGDKMDDEEQQDQMEIDMGLRSFIDEQLFKDKEYPEGWQKIEQRIDEGLIHEWRNRFKDSIRIQFTDASLYIITINSGQY